MDELRLAQFSHLSCQRKVDLLKKVDVNYCLQDAPYQSERTKFCFGKTYLHIAVRKSCTASVDELLNQGVDLFKQSSDTNYKEGMTPLQLAMRYIDKKWVFLWNKMGIIKNEMADALLSAQVDTDKTLNPKSCHGVSHFHIACMVNHAEAVKFFLDAGEPIDQAFDSKSLYLPGYTGLHCAIRYSSVEAAKTLVDYGADVHLKDAKGKSSLHLLIERMIDLTDYINMGKRACCLVIKEELKRMQIIISYILENKISKETNFVEDTGLTALHIASALSETSLVENFLQQDVDINASVNSDSDFWPGYTPLHFAAYFNVETVKLLLQRGSDITKSADGKTVLDLCMERYSPKIIHSILSCIPEFKNIVFSDGSTNLLDVLLLMDDCGKFNNFLQSLSDVNIYVSYDSPLWPGNTLLHLSILMSEKALDLKKFYAHTFHQENTNASEKSYNCSESEELAYWKRIVTCLVRGCSLLSKNADGLTPIHLAFKLLKKNIVDKLLNSCKSDAADPINLTHFHIACATGKKALVELFLSQGLNVNTRVKKTFTWCHKLEIFRESPKLISVQADSTPLHLAVIFDQKEIVKLLLQNGANVYAQDAFGLTPIHFSLRFYSNNKSMAQLLLDKTPDLKEVVSKQGLTHLHVAAFADNDKAIDELLKVGSEVDAVFKYEALEEKSNHYYDMLSDYAEDTPLYLAAKNDCSNAARALIRGGADISKRIDFEDFDISPLIEAIDCIGRDSSKCIMNKAKREYKEVIGPIIESGVTMLHIACASFDIKWVKKLLERGADVNSRIRNSDEFENDGWRGHTPLHVLVAEACEAEKVPKNLLVLAKLLFKYGADVTIRDTYVPSTPLHDIYDKVNESKIDNTLFSSMVNLFLNSHKSYDVNPKHFNSGLSHFHIACIRNNIEVVKNFLAHGVDINHHVDYYHYDYTSGFTPLHFAFDNRHKDLARLLIERGANIHAEAVNGDTPLHVALTKNCADLEIIEMFHRNGADFNAKNLKDMTPMMCLFKMENFTIEQFDFFLKHDCKFDVTMYNESCEGIVGLAMKNAEPSERNLIFQKFVQTDNVKRAIADGFNAIRSIVLVNQDGCLTLEFYIHAIKLLMEMGCDIDQQDEYGNSLIQDAVFFYNLEALQALLHFGADFNIVDNENKSPLSGKVFSNDDTKKERQSEVIKTIVIHASKMKFIGLLESSIEKEFSKLSGNRIIMDNVTLIMCGLELKEMKNTKIYNGLTVQSFINKDLCTYSLMSSSKRKHVDNFFKNSEKIKQMFPELGGLLNMHYRKAVSKMKQLDSLKKC